MIQSLWNHLILDGKPLPKLAAGLAVCANSTHKGQRLLLLLLSQPLSRQPLRPGRLCCYSLFCVILSSHPLCWPSPFLSLIPALLTFWTLALKRRKYHLSRKKTNVPDLELFHTVDINILRVRYVRYRYRSYENPSDSRHGSCHSAKYTVV